MRENLYYLKLDFYNKVDHYRKSYKIDKLKVKAEVEAADTEAVDTEAVAADTEVEAVVTEVEAEVKFDF